MHSGGSFLPDGLKTFMDQLKAVRRNARGALALHVWAALGTCLAPLLPFYLRRRQMRGKEIPARVREKMGFPSLPRPSGPLLWFHAASVGEVLSILPLVQACLRQDPDITVLVTTGTVTASTIVAQRFAHSRVVHQFVPLDVPRWCQRFLDSWTPQVAIFTESELWPTLLSACHTRDLPVVLVNGRMSASSFQVWRHIPGVARHMLSCFAWVSARSKVDAQRLRTLGAITQTDPGDLKTAAPPLPVQAAEMAHLQAFIGARPVFVAVSTHAGEEAQVAQATYLARQTCPTLLTIVVPRHPERGAEVASLLNSAPRRALDALPTAQDAFWVCDTLGELGLFFRLATCVFVGNSLPGCHGGGHNPFEPARLGCAMATGPLIHNFEEAFQALHGCVQHVRDARSMAAWVEQMVTHPKRRAELGKLAQQVATVNEALPDDLAEKILALV